MPELAYQVTPERLHPRLKVVVHSRCGRLGFRGYVTGDSEWRIDLYPTGMLDWCPSESIGVFQFTAWYEILRTYLHEVGHIETEFRKTTNRYWADLDRYWADLDRYGADSNFHRFVERLANDWRDKTIERIADRDERLGQPSGWIGGLPGTYLLKLIRRSARSSAKDPSPPGYFTTQTLEDYRAYRSGGQLTLTQVLKLGGERYGPRHRRGSQRRAVVKEADRLGISRHWTDKAGRRHRYFTYGEARAVLARISPFPPPAERMSALLGTNGR